MRAFFLSIICVLMLTGCSGESDIKKINTGFMSRHYKFMPDAAMISYIRGRLPHKTYLSIFDISTRKIRQYRFANYSLDGPHSVIDEIKKAIAGSTYVAGIQSGKRILVIDLDKKRIVYELPIAGRCQYFLIERPRWSKKVFVLYGLIQEDRIKERSLFYKWIDPQTHAMSDSEHIGQFEVKNALLLEKKPYLLLDVIEENETKLLVYDLSSGSMIHQLPTKSNFLTLEEPKDRNILYGLIQVPGDNRGVIVEFDSRDMTEKSAIKIEGHLETMIVVSNIAYVIGKDFSPARKRRQYWLHPRRLYMVDLLTKSLMGTVEWTEREGEFVGFDREENRIYYAVTDADRPALWSIRNSWEALSKINQTVK